MHVCSLVIGGRNALYRWTVGKAERLPAHDNRRGGGERWTDMKARSSRTLNVFMGCCLYASLLLGCRIETDQQQDDLLSIPRVPYLGDDLRLIGYYYDLYNNQYYDLNFLFRNGVLLHCGSGYDQTAMTNLEADFASGAFHSMAFGSKTAWGVFLIDSPSVALERWYPSSGGPLKSYVLSGTIVNDSAFHITGSRRSNGTELQSVDFTYHFKQFGPKPDSTNQFVP